MDSLREELTGGRAMVLWLRPGHDDEMFEVFFAAVARWVHAQVPETVRQCEHASMQLPCGVLIPGTAIPGRRLVRSGLVLVPPNEAPFIRFALDQARVVAAGVE